MKKASVIWLFCLGVWLCCPGNAQTPTPAPLDFTATPTKLTVATVRGVPAVRQVLFRTNADADFNVVTLDLTRSDDAAILPAKNIVLAPGQGKLIANRAQTVAVTFSLMNTPSGEFNGELRVEHAGGHTAIPVTVKIKDWWLWPLLTLGLGVALSFFVNFYREQGRPRDEVVVRAAQLRAEMQTEIHLAVPFRTRIEAALIDVDAALRAKKWDEARKSLEAAETVLDRWRKAREDWRRQLEFGKTLFDKIVQAEGRSIGENIYLKTLRHNLEDAMSKAPDANSHAVLRDELDTFAGQFEKYHAARQQLDALVVLIRNRSDEDEQRQSLRQLQARLESLTPTNDASYQLLLDDVEAMQSELKPPSFGIREVSAATAKGGGESLIQQLGLSAPRLLNPLTTEVVAARARWNLTWMTRLLCLLSWALMIGTGYVQLYEGKPVFGANAWTDYFGLLAWGFGVEATRGAVVDWIKGFGLSVGK